jgi:hypothetical protein
MKPENDAILTVGIIAIAGAIGRHYYPTTSDPFVSFGLALLTVFAVRAAWDWWKSRP